jgi:hypothetical protein
MRSGAKQALIGPYTLSSRKASELVSLNPLAIYSQNEQDLYKLSINLFLPSFSRSTKRIHA